MAANYLHIQCEAYSLLTDIQQVEQVIAGQWADAEGTVSWNDSVIPCLNLLQLLTGNVAIASHHCIIMKNADTQDMMAVLVGKVNNVQMIADHEFDDLPDLDFPFNDYFDKVYIHPSAKHCIYRLKSLFAVRS